jgi:glycogen synthase
MNILHVTRDFPPRHHGGISSAVGRLARAQSRAGLGVAILSFDAWRPCAATAAAAPAAQEASDGIAVLRLTSTQQLAGARGFASEQRPTLLHVHDGLLWSVGARLRAELAIPAVHSVHVVQRYMNELRGSRERTLSLAGEEAALAAADRVIAPSHSAADVLLASNPGLAPRLRVVGHGIDDSSTARAAAAHHAANPAHGPLLAVGRFGDIKGTPELFEVMRTVLTRLPDAGVTVAGGIPANRRAETRWRRRWQTATPERLQARARFTGWLDGGALAAQYHDAAVLVVPSRYETFGLVALEAMLRGLPVASTAAGGLAELIAHGETGLLSAPRDAAALADHAIALLRDPDLARRLGQRAAAAARGHHLWEQVLPRLLGVYAEIV